MDHDVLIVGGGVVVLSTGLHIARRMEIGVAVVEKEHHLASHQSGRNSAVLHPGFNYEPGSMKAKFATEGTSRMKEYCREHDIPVREFGVVVSALDQEERRLLDDLKAQAKANGTKAQIIGEDEVADREPNSRFSGFTTRDARTIKSSSARTRSSPSVAKRTPTRISTCAN